MASRLSVVLAVATAFLLAPPGTNGRNLLQTARTVQWQVPANGAYEPISVAVGSTVTFTWSIVHDLWRLPSGNCPASFTESNTVVREAPQGRNGRKAITFDTPGTYHFACSVSTHCAEGQLIQITVTGSSSANAPGRGPAPAPGRAPAPAPGPGSKPGSSAPSAQPAVSIASAVVTQPTVESEPTEAEEPVEESEEEEHSEESEGYGGEGYEHNYRKR